MAVTSGVCTPSVSSDLKSSKQWTGRTDRYPTAADAIEVEVRKALAICGATSSQPGELH
jgi:hypothetical protein